MWIKFLLNLKGNLNIKEKCFVNGFIASDKVRHLKKELVMTTESKICPVFFFHRKEHFDICIKEIELWIESYLCNNSLSLLFYSNINMLVDLDLFFYERILFFLFLDPFCLRIGKWVKKHERMI